MTNKNTVYESTPNSSGSWLDGRREPSFILQRWKNKTTTWGLADRILGPAIAAEMESLGFSATQEKRDAGWRP